MVPDFGNMLTDIFKRNGSPKIMPRTKVGAELNRAIKQVTAKKPEWYNIHRISTNGRINKPVFFRVNEHDANLLINKFLKASEEVDEETGKTECILYEKFDHDKRVNLYENDCDITKEG